MQKTDEEWAIEAQNGNQKAVEYLIEKYMSLVKSISRRFFLVGGEQEDLIQEGMMALYRAILRFKKGQNAKFLTYAHTLINNQIISAVKRANNKKNLVLSNALYLNSQGFATYFDNEKNEHQLIMYLPIYENGPEKKLIEREEYFTLVKNIKESLSDYEFKILKMYLEGYKNSQISKMTNKDSKSTENAINRIKTKLKQFKQ